MRAMLAAGLVAGLVGLAGAGRADDKKDDPTSDQKLLVGKWKLAKLSPGELPSGVEVVLDVKKDGTFKITQSADGRKDESTATWKLDGKKLTMEFTAGSRKGTKQTDTVKELTQKKLVLVDEKDTTEEWERVTDKAGDK